MIFNMNIEYANLFLFMYPLAIIPYSYVSSFLFVDDTTAQIITLFTHFIAGALLMLTVYVLQIVPITGNAGDALRYVGMLFPSFCVTNGIFLS